MVIRNHIAYRFLTDETLVAEMCGEMYPSDWKKTRETLEIKRELISTSDIDPKIATFITLTNNQSQKPYYVTESVIKNLELLKVKRNGAHFNWSVFKSIKPQKLTLILPDNKVLRIRKQESGTLELFWLRFEKYKEPKAGIEGKMKWVMLFMDTNTGDLCEHFDSMDGLEYEEFIYKLLCFFFLTENTEEIVAPRSVVGTRKTGKMSNDFNFPLTMVTSSWNVTSVRLDGFMVSGHFRVQPCGAGRTNYEIIFISPFQKHGYVRKAKSLDELT